MLQKTGLLLALALTLLTAATALPPQADESAYQALRREAERYVEQKSFARAHAVYEQAAKLELTPEERRWVEFRLADTAWRNDAGSRSADPTVREKARRALEEMVRREEHDRIWAEANESLGDSYFLNPYERNPYPAQQYYLAALDYWAGSDDIEYARKRYLDIVWRMADTQRYHIALPREVLVNTLTIARTTEEKARARYLLANVLANEGPAGAERALEHFEAIIALGNKTEWYDDALVRAAQFYAAGTNVVVNGQLERRPDYKRSLELYRRLVNEFKPGESAYREHAERAIKEILEPSVGVVVTSTFLPDSEQEVHLAWRNVKQVRLSLTAVDLTTDVLPDHDHAWLTKIRTTGAVVRTWTFDTNDKGEHIPGIERIRLTPRLEPGAYAIVAESGTQRSQNLVLVTDAHILVHASPRKLHVYVSDVETGEPIAGARVRTWHRQRDDRQREVTRDSRTSANGIAEIEPPSNTFMTSLITASAGSARQAYHHPNVYTHGNEQPYVQDWKLYAFTDRPAYRPSETVQWKLIARARDVQQRWTNTAGQRLKYDILDPRGEKVASCEAKLNEFGAFWSELPLTASMPLGAYTINFETAEGRGIGGAQLFRLEEYKLPEFQVSVTTPRDDAGKPKRYRLGETIEATIEASYYFGGPVANATVEAVIYQQPLYRHWYPWREYHWLYDRPYMGDGTVMRRETLRTDAAGKATLRIDTNADGGEMLYRIEARVVDASRREVRGTGSVRVTRQRYSVIAHPEHHIHRPGDPVEIDFKAMDANDQPVQTTGTVKVVRREWRQREKFAGYHEEDVLTTTVNTDANGEATFTFTPKRDGYYTIRWTSEDRDPDKPARVADLVTAETSVWVADRNSIDLGYRANNIEIIVDKETMRAGQTAMVMIVAPASGRWVVLTSTADDILETQVLRLDGTVKLVQVPLDERHRPNFFLTATSIFDRGLSTDTERVVVPPVEHFLEVEVKSDREQYEPRQEGAVTITTRDVDGKPVSAEVALAVSDDAVTAIQEDFAGDPRQFFFGETRSPILQVSGGVQVQQYVRLVRDEDGKLIDDRFVEEAEEVQSRRLSRLKSSGVMGGVVGGRADAAAEMAPPPPPAPVMAMEGVVQAVTVTANAPMMKQEGSAVANDAAAAGPAVEVRTDFRSTAFWRPNIVTDASGTATVRFKYPEALTTWRATARAASRGMQFGMGSSTARTSMPLLVRLQAPRFFVVGDRTTISAVINNNTDAAMRVAPKLEVEGLALAAGSSAEVEVPARGEARADWTVVAERAGNAKLRVSGRGSQHGDAMEKTFIVYEHGVDKLVARSGKLRGSEAQIRLDLPRERRATDLVVQVAPSLAVTMLDALPYLIDFPYGCTEQTMSRFLPAAIVARTLKQMGLDERQIEGRIFGGIEKPGQPKQGLRKLDAVAAASMQRLYDMQNGDGSWGWWKGGDGDSWMTAYVVWGFAVARDGGLEVSTSRVDRAAAWLDNHLVKSERDINRQAWLLHGLSAWNTKPSRNATKALENIWKSRERLTAYSRALLALSAHRYGDKEKTAILVENLENGAQIDRAPDQSVIIKGTTTTAETMATVHWGARGFWWHWYDSPVETTSFVLQALVAIDPKHKLIEPAMNWLVKNRRGAQWSNTRDTAIAVLSLNDYLRASGETAGETSYEVSVNGKVIATKTVTAAEVIGAPSRFSVDPSILTDTTQDIRIRKTGGRADAPLYFSAEARFVSLEEPVKAAGNELFVRRQYFRLAPRPTLLKGVLYDRVPLNDRDKVASGERIEVVVTVETKNDYEYLMFEDLKPAGFEAVELQSGHGLFAQELRKSDLTKQTGGIQPVYQELRDRKVAMFIDRLQQGVWEIRYTLRAETPGSFHALPLLGQAMYVPEIRANGDEVRVEVVEPAPPVSVSLQ